MSWFGYSVAVSSGGSTALIGGPNDNSDVGAAWVFTRSNGVWFEQQKLVQSYPGGSEGRFGASVALSADGNTALIGGPEDRSSGVDQNIGAAWVYVHSGTTWSEQQKIVPADEPSNDSKFGFSVALSADGSTALVGGPQDGSNCGAAWVYRQSGATWVKQQKIVPADETGPPLCPGFGSSVALSAEGNTALIGDPVDSSDAGAAWVYTSSGATWSEQQKIIPADETGSTSHFGSSVALSTDGSTALIGGPADGDDTGAGWAFTLSGATWSEQQKIVPGDETGSTSQFGDSVALSSEGVALIGGLADNNDMGATWVFDAPAISIPTDLSFGSQTTGQPGPVQWLEVLNSGQELLTFTGEAQISGTDASDFTIPSGDDLCDDATLEPGQDCWIGVQFTAGANGARSATLNFASNNGVGPASLNITGTGVPANSGPAGANGTNGAQGPTGAAGPQGQTGSTGPAGPAGKNGEVELVTCKSVTAGTDKNKKTIQKCTIKLASSPVTIMTTGRSIKAVLSRGKVVYATGSATVSGKHTKLLLALRRSIVKGNYTLTLARVRKRQHETITID